MDKLVVMRLDGDASGQGFRVTATIGEEDSIPQIEITGELPAAPELANHLQHHWEETYRSIGAPYRIKTKRIIYDGSINECKNSADELRDRLTTWLNSEEFRGIDKRLREELNRDEAIRFLIRTEDKLLQKLPWHLWDFFEHYPKAEIALIGKTFEKSKPTSNTTQKATIKILAILGHSEGIDIKTDRRLLENLPHAETTFLIEKTRKEINDKLWEQPWDIIFFAGHSETEGEQGRIYINPTESLTIDELWYALKKAVERGLKLAIFNSCDGLGLARRLDDLHIPQMIVMRELVPDLVAQEFLKHFLAAFASGQPLYLAAREARERLQGLESQFPCASWLPVIWQNIAAIPPTWGKLPAPQPQSWWRDLQKVMLTSLAVTGLVMGARSLGLLQSWELKTFDQMMQLRPVEPPDPRLLIVKVTAEDIDKLGGEYPLSDRTMLRLLQKLEAYQPRVIGLDIYRDRPEGEGRAELIKYLKQSDRIIPVCTVPSTNLPQGVAPPAGVSDEQVGFADAVRDPDGIFRRHLLAMKPPAASSCSTFYALSFQLALRYLKSKNISLHFITKNQWKLGSVVLKKLEPHTGFYHQRESLQGFQVLLNYRSRQSLSEVAEQVTLTDTLNNRIKPNFVKDKIILIGVTDPTVEDNANTPYNQEIRGLLLHAHMVSQIVSAVEEQRPLLKFWPLWLDGLWVLNWSLVGGILTLQFLGSPRRWGLAGGIAIISLNGIYGICFILLFTTGTLLPLVPSMIGLVATGGSFFVQGFRLKDESKYSYLTS